MALDFHSRVALPHCVAKNISLMVARACRLLQAEHSFIFEDTEQQHAMIQLLESAWCRVLPGMPLCPTAIATTTSTNTSLGHKPDCPFKARVPFRA